MGQVSPAGCLYTVEKMRVVEDTLFDCFIALKTQKNQPTYQMKRYLAVSIWCHTNTKKKCFTIVKNIYKQKSLDEI